MVKEDEKIVNVDVVLALTLPPHDKGTEIAPSLHVLVLLNIIVSLNAVLTLDRT